MCKTFGMDKPGPPPEAALIKTALKSRRLTARAAARQAGIGEARWYQIMRGSQTVSGTTARVVAPPDTLARMAQVVGVTPEQLDEVGRTDAAEELRTLATEQPATTPADNDGDPRLRALTAVWRTLTPAERDRELRRLQREQESADDAEPPYADLSDPEEYAVWMLDIDRNDRRTMIDIIRAGRAKERRKPA